MLSRFRLLVLCCSIGAIKINVSGAQSAINITADFDRSSDIEVQESDGFAEVCVVLSGSLTSPASFIVNANSNIDALSGEDYEPLDRVTLSFEVSELRKCINITILEDSLEEGDVGEIIGVQILSGSSSSGEDDILINSNQLSVSILDSDILLLGFTQAIYEAVEAETQEVCAQIFNGNLDSDVVLRVFIKITNSTGLSIDHNLLIFSDNTTVNCVNITIDDDEIIEEMQTLKLTLQEDNLDVLFEGNATLLIHDDDSAEVELQDAEFQLLEGFLDMQRNQNVCIVLVNDFGGLRRDIVLSITLSSDNATSGVDFVPLSMNLTIPTGATVNHEVCFQLTIIGDDQSVENESFSIMLAPITPDIIVGESVLNVIIIDGNDTISCGTMNNPMNGSVQLDGGTMIGAMAFYNCHTGFRLVGDGLRVCGSNGLWSGEEPICIVNNPCAVNPCDSNAVCNNTDDSFTCTCKNSYTGDGFTCRDINECTTGTHNCDTNARCTNTPGSFTCSCNQGYSGNGLNCVDINECTDGTDLCANGARCTNTPGSYTCACNPGYYVNGPNCVDINECTEGTDLCATDARCTNTPGSFTCACNQGYSGNGLNCVDINECVDSTVLCANAARCTNTPGSYTCACNHGYRGNGLNCVDINECADGTARCLTNSHCLNYAGFYGCVCNHGYRRNGFFCSDINECASSRNNNCGTNAVCTNTPGSYTCACNQGYSGNGRTCVDIDECITDTDNCDTNAVCTNTPGSFTCSCNDGYIGNGLTCMEAPTPRLPTSVLVISITTSNATIQWILTDPYNSSHPETFTVLYGNSSGQLNSNTPDKTANSNSQTYSTQLNSLQPGTVYFYKIRSMNDFDTVFTGEMSFLTNETNCGSPPEGEGVIFTISNSQSVAGELVVDLDAVATYSCVMEGYVIEDTNNLTCVSVNDTAQWDPAEAPVCEQEISCGTMNNPMNGSVRLDGGTVIGAMAFYNCQTGFRLVGDGLRVCGSNGLWSGEEPICIVNDQCADDPCDSNAVCNNTDNSFTCTCNNSYTGDGFTCRANCGSPPEGEGVRFTISDSQSVAGELAVDLDAVATYSCVMEGYVIEDVNTLTCVLVNNTAQWYPAEAPVCVQANCGSPPEGEGVKFTISDSQSVAGELVVDLDAVATYSCVMEGYVIEGANNLTCVSVNNAPKWHPAEAPVCEQVISCGTMNNPTNGNVRLDGGTVIGAMAFYNCQTGFRLVGDGLRVCGSNGLWSGEEPICIANNQCADDPCDSNAVCNNTDDSFTCTCNNSYTGDGFTCRANCGSPPEGEGVRFTISDSQSEAEELVVDLYAVATYSCVIEGYVIEDVNTLTCVLVNNTAQWYPAEAPMCEQAPTPPITTPPITTPPITTPPITTTPNVLPSSSNISRNIRIGVGMVVGGALLLVLLVFIVVFTLVHVKKGKMRSKRVLNYNTVYGPENCRSSQNDNYEENRRPSQNDDYEENRRPSQNDDYEENRRPSQNDDYEENRRPSQNDDDEENRRPSQNDDDEENRRPSQNDDYEENRRPSQNDDYEENRRPSQNDDYASTLAAISRPANTSPANSATVVEDFLYAAQSHKR